MQDRLEEYKESNTSPSTYMPGWAYITTLGKNYQDAFAQIPKQYYPDNPANEGFFPTGKTGFAKIFTQYILPFIPVFSLITAWVNTAKTVKAYYYALNKNYDNTLDLTVNVLTTLGTSTFWGLLLLGNTTTCVFVAPYVMVGTLGLGMMYGLYGIIKRICDAAVAETPAARSIHHWEIWKQLINFAIQTIGFAATIAFGVQIGPKLTNAANLLQDALRQWDLSKLTKALVLIEAAGDSFRAVKTLYYLFTGLVTIGMVTSAWELNLETIRYLSNPDKIFDDVKAKYGLLQQTVEGLSPYLQPVAVLASLPLIVGYIALGAVNLLARTLSLVFVWPLQMILRAPDDFPQNDPQPIIAEEQIEEKVPDVLPNNELEVQHEQAVVGSSAKQVMHLLGNAKQEEEHAALRRMVNEKLDILEAEMNKSPSEKRRHKIDFLRRLKNEKLKENVDDFNKAIPMALLVEEAKDDTWFSFRRRVGVVEKIKNVACHCEVEWRRLAPR